MLLECTISIHKMSLVKCKVFMLRLLFQSLNVSTQELISSSLFLAYVS